MDTQVGFSVPRTGTDTLVISIRAKVSIWIKKSNPVKRVLSKLCLNLMWGKLTEGNDRNRTKVISDSQKLYRFLATSGIEAPKLMFASVDVVCASWRYIAEEKVPNLLHTNEVIDA